MDRMRRLSCTVACVLFISEVAFAQLEPPGNVRVVDSPAIALWASPDGMTLTGEATLGVVAYHFSQIRKVDFRVGTGAVTEVTAASVNPATGELEFVLQLDTTELANGVHAVAATAYPNAGQAKTLAPRRIFVANGVSYDTWYVAGSGDDTNGDGSSSRPFRSLDRACKAADGGDTILVMNGNFAIPDQKPYGFEQYVTIKPAPGQNPVITECGTIRSSYIKFEDMFFRADRVQDPVINSTDVTHLWFSGCTFVGVGKDVTDNRVCAVRFYRLTGSSEITGRFSCVENCIMHDMDTGVKATNGESIIRGNLIYDLTSDGIGYDGENVLITGNTIHDNHVPPGGSQHCDFIQSNVGANNIVIRNNYCYNGDAQGNKFGGWSDRSQVYTNIAFVGNVMATGDKGSANFRFEGAAKGKRFENILVEHNTIWNGSSTFVIEASLDAENIVVRNNIFGPKPVSVQSMAGVSMVANHTAHSGDPIFVDAANWDFRLNASSPCIDKGTSNISTAVDLRGVPRGSSPDLGAYELLPEE